MTRLSDIITLIFHDQKLKHEQPIREIEDDEQPKPLHPEVQKILRDKESADAKERTQLKADQDKKIALSKATKLTKFKPLDLHNPDQQKKQPAVRQPDFTGPAGFSR